MKNFSNAVLFLYKSKLYEFSKPLWIFLLQP